MHLLDQAIEHADSVTPRQQRTRKMPAYKARSTGDQSQFLHICATTPVFTENVQIFSKIKFRNLSYFIAPSWTGGR
ncbi:hypothetical protein [Methylorubrum extorquens]|uniref:hypothetical protein n=1 Tax=Methylorubrum extorquens TaxID=408 RepID=UPI002238565A|nr:hypothetical protein [Methylorubrum extorquens]UYW35274.1 hypothetical protein OKB92_06255 [Methylorubrum extorquens]